MELPRTERGRRTRERIVESAAELMLRQGVAGTSVDEVLARSGAGKSQFYHYFVDKEALIRAVLEWRARQALEELAPVLDSLDRWEGIRAWFDQVVRIQEARGFVGGCPIGSLAAERSEADPEFRLELDEALRFKGERLEEGLRRMEARGELRPGADPAGMAAFVTAVLQGALLMASVRKRRDALEPVLDEAFRYLRSHARAPDPSGGADPEVGR